MAGQFVSSVLALQEFPLSGFQTLPDLLDHSLFQGKIPNTKVLALCCDFHACLQLMCVSIWAVEYMYVAAVCRLMLQVL